MVLCFCVDFRHLNMQTKKDLHPLPHIQEVLESMMGLAHFLSMDFKSGFWQIKMAPESQQYKAFMVGNLRFYEFTCMPFGLCNAPVTFQHLMQNTLGELNLMYCMIYLDDVIIFGCTEEEHLECLYIVLATCCKWLHLRKDTLLPKWDALLKECLGVEAETEQSKMFFHICNSLILNKGLMYVSTTPKSEIEGVLTFVVPVGQCWMMLNSVYHDAGDQG